MTNMTSTAPIGDDLRDRIISQPEVILDDHELMRVTATKYLQSAGTAPQTMHDSGQMIAPLHGIETVNRSLDSPVG